MLFPSALLYMFKLTRQSSTHQEVNENETDFLKNCKWKYAYIQVFLINVLSGEKIDIFCSMSKISSMHFLQELKSNYYFNVFSSENCSHFILSLIFFILALVIILAHIYIYSYLYILMCIMTFVILKRIFSHLFVLNNSFHITETVAFFFI